MTLKFDAEKHHYFWNGERVANVTSCLHGLVDFSKIPKDVLENARQEGVAIHLLVQLEIEGDLNVASLPEWLRGYYDSWMRFKEVSGFEGIYSELRLYHSAWRFATTPDIVADLKTKGGERTRCLIEVKRSLYGGPVIGVQLAGQQLAYNYAMASDNPHVPVERRFALRLDKADKKFKLEEFKEEDDQGMFTACLSRFKWLMKKGMV